MPKLERGQVRIGQIVSTDEVDRIVSIALDETGVMVTWPRELDFTVAMRLNDLDSERPLLVFRDPDGFLTLSEGASVGASASTVGVSQETLRFRRALATGARGIDYSHVNGMSSEIEGLATWAKLPEFTTAFELDHDKKYLKTLQIAVQNREPLTLGGPLGISLNTSIWHSPKRREGALSIVGKLSVHTESDALERWETHAAAHHMLQDLMCLAYGRPCAARLESVVHHDDQELENGDGRRVWAEAYEPEFGRGGVGVDPLPEDAKPLFYLDECDSGKVAHWLSEFQLWSRPTWIAVTTMFQKNSTVEAYLLQVGIALESLGYALWTRTPSDAKTPSFVSLLKTVTEAASVDLKDLFGVTSMAAWRKGFNAAFLGAKHADNPLPDSSEALLFANQGMALIRCWLACQLGVESELVAERVRRR